MTAPAFKPHHEPQSPDYDTRQDEQREEELQQYLRGLNNIQVEDGYIVYAKDSYGNKLCDDELDLLNEGIE